MCGKRCEAQREGHTFEIVCSAGAREMEQGKYQARARAENLVSCQHVRKMIAKRPQGSGPLVAAFGLVYAWSQAGVSHKKEQRLWKTNKLNQGANINPNIRSSFFENPQNKALIFWNSNAACANTYVTLYNPYIPLNWVAVKELKLSYYSGETLLFTIYTHYGNLI